jgi:hypothetical protein
MTEILNVRQAIERVILANPRPDVSQEELAAVAEAGRTLISAIPGVIGMSFGVSMAANAPHRWIVRIRFRDAQALQTYETHPNHVNFGIQQWLPVIADQVQTDYWIQY